MEVKAAKLRVGECYTNKEYADQKCLVIQIAWWHWLKLLTFEKVAGNLVARITRLSVSEVQLQIKLDKELLEVLETVIGMITIEVIDTAAEELRLVSSFSVSSDRSQLTIFSDGESSLADDVISNQKFLVQHIANTSNPFFCITSRVTLAKSEKQLQASVSKSLNGSVKKCIEATKREIAFLIGTKGERIEEIREISQAVIQILPIEQRFSRSALANSTAIIQQILIHGDQYTVDIAVSIIESNLKLYELFPRHARKI